MAFAAFDLETHLFGPGLLTPPIVVGSIADDGPPRILVGAEQAIAEFEHLAKQTTDVLVGAHFAYDLACIAAARPDLIPVIFSLVRDGRAFDVLIAEALNAISGGFLGRDPRTGGKIIDPDTGKQKDRHNLTTVVDHCLGRKDAKKNDFWKMRYAILEHVPVEEWPTDARQYPVDDVVNAREVAVHQSKNHRNLGDMTAQTRFGFAVYLGAIWGLRTDPERVGKLNEEVEESHKAYVARFAAGGFLVPNEKKPGEWKEVASVVKRAVATAYGASGVCGACSGTGKVTGKPGKPNKKGIARPGNPVICTLKANAGTLFDGVCCDGSGLDLSTAPGLPRTPTGGIQCDRDALAESGDDLLAEYGDNEAEKTRDTYLPFLKEGLTRPITLRPNVLLESGRASYDGLIQLLPRAGGIRECFGARPGYVLCSVDYAALELCTLAQVLLWTTGRSQMAERINASGDPGFLHTALAARLTGEEPAVLAARIKAGDKIAAGYRYSAKALNFGLPGGMGAATFVRAKRKKIEGSTTGADGHVYAGIRFCILIGGAERCGVEKVTEWKGRTYPPLCKRCVELVEFTLKPAWLAENDPEMKQYFNWVTTNVESSGELPCFAPMRPEGYSRMRGGLDFTNGANNGFQALAADGAKHALWKVSEECHTMPDSPLWGTHPIQFVHDEIIAEMPEDKAHLAGPRMAAVMVAAMKEWVPDVTIKAEPALMIHLSKSAEPVYDADGKLIVWHPKEKSE